jgi:hypothetical protein
LLAILATFVGALTFTAFAADAKSTSTTTSTSTVDQSQSVNQLQFGAGMMADMQGFGGGPRGHGGGFMGGMANIEVSSEYAANVNSILNNDTDVQNLISQGYNVTSINPIIRNIVEADGTIATKATTAVVLLQNGTSGYATVNVDVANTKVTQIVIVTRTVIDKSSS